MPCGDCALRGLRGEDLVAAPEDGEFIAAAVAEAHDAAAAGGAAFGPFDAGQAGDRSVGAVAFLGDRST